MRKPKNRVRPQVEAMESRALLSTLAPLSTPHHVESRGLSSALAPLSAPHDVDTGVAEIRRQRHQEFDASTVRITNATKHFEINVWTILKVDGQEVDKSKPDVIKHGDTKTFKITKRPSSSWFVWINVSATGRGPKPPVLNDSLTKPSIQGYFGKIFTVIVTNNNTKFEVKG